MANMCWSMEYVTVFAQQQPCKIVDIMAVKEQLVTVPMRMEMITNVMGVWEGSSNTAKMRKVRVPRRRGRKKLVK